MFHWKNTPFHSAIFNFKTRSKQRDRQVDTARFAILNKALSEVTASIEQERAGLQKRYDDATSGAASLVVAEENNEAPLGSHKQLNKWTTEIIAYNARMKSLSNMADHMLKVEACLRSNAQTMTGADQSKPDRCLMICKNGLLYKSRNRASLNG